MKKQKIKTGWMLFLLFVTELGFTAIPKPKVYVLNTSMGTQIPSNSINDIVSFGNDIWVATGNGLAKTSDHGATWKIFTQQNGLGKGSVSAIAMVEGLIWVATAYDTTTPLGTFPAGGGLSWSTDNGKTWHWIPQPMDSREETRYKPTTTNIQNLTYDIEIVVQGTDTTVWIASFGGGLRKSSDRGKTWDVVTVDGHPFDALGFLTHRAFSVFFDGVSLWVGTAGGIHQSFDYGKTWITYTHQNQTRPISGNFVVAIATQKTEEREIVWAGTVNALDSTEFRAVSKSEDNGLTWSTHLSGVFAYNFAFDGSKVFVATDQGLYYSPDYGETWSLFPQIRDPETGEAFYGVEMYSVAVDQEGGLWVGGSEGLAYTPNLGLTWRIFRSFPIPGEKGQPKTYAYPNPFSPLGTHLEGKSEGYVRFQYTVTKPGSVTVLVYDSGLHLVRTVVQGKERSQGSFSEVWDGKNDLGEVVANGVYFYRIEIGNETPIWGKVMVIK